MFQQAPGLTSSVGDPTDQVTYDALRVNYYGLTQQNGQQISFYQRGVLCGTATSPTDMSVYANEIWLKGYIGTLIANALLGLTEIPANASGQATLLTLIQSGAELAKTTGVISVGNTLTQVQIAAITAESGSVNAWRQIQTSGYWLTVFFSTFTGGGGDTEYQGNYTLIYTKNNAIRKVNGTHSLI
jgi:hypothetical protein